MNNNKLWALALMIIIAISAPYISSNFGFGFGFGLMIFAGLVAIILPLLKSPNSTKGDSDKKDNPDSKK